MSNKLVVLQGKSFYVELQSMLGSTNYGWCLKSMPEELLLTGTQNTHTRPGISPMMQRFYFSAVSAETTNVEVTFVLACLSNVSDVTDEFKAEIQIVPSNSDEFVSYSENGPAPQVIYGITYMGDQETVCGDNAAALKYGYPCGNDTPFIRRHSCGPENTPFIHANSCNTNTAFKYGYPCGVNDANLKYGYSCGANDARLAYGYPCGVNDANLKYGYPCGVNDATLKYGYPVMEYGLPYATDLTAMPYGLVYSNNACADYTMDSRPYGMVYTGQDARLYAFPMNK